MARSVEEKEMLIAIMPDGDSQVDIRLKPRITAACRVCGSEASDELRLEETPGMAATRILKYVKHEKPCITKRLDEMLKAIDEFAIAHRYYDDLLRKIGSPTMFTVDGVYADQIGRRFAIARDRVLSFASEDARTGRKTP